MNVPFLDLAAQHESLRTEILGAWEAIFDSGRFVSGSEVAAFEEEFAAVHEVDHCVAVSSGTSALTLILSALGVGPGDRVIVPANTFIATAEAVSHVGAAPALVDCGPDRNIDTAAAAAALSHDGVVAVVGVHLYGLPADFEALSDAARRCGAWAIEDAAQAHLALHRGRSVGGLGVMAAFSFYPGKNLGAPGEGGAITTDDAGLADEVRALRDHGQKERYHSDSVGYNARMMELVAAALRVKLRHLPKWTEGRRRVAQLYRDRLETIPEVKLPASRPWSQSSYHLFPVEVHNRDEVAVAMTQAGIGVGMHYPVPIHLQPAYRGLGHVRGDFPEAEDNADRVLSLPMYPELTDDQVDFVCSVLRDSVAGHPDTG